MNDDFIYTATAGHLEHNKWRCWAWFASLEEAQRAVTNCPEVFWDNYYEDLVIEEIPRGAITPAYNEHWYKWDGETWLPSEKPLSVEVLHHFGIG